MMGVGCSAVEPDFVILFACEKRLANTSVFEYGC